MVGYETYYFRAASTVRGRFLLTFIFYCFVCFYVVTIFVDLCANRETHWTVSNTSCSGRRTRITFSAVSSRARIPFFPRPIRVLFSVWPGRFRVHFSGSSDVTHFSLLFIFYFSRLETRIAFEVMHGAREHLVGAVVSDRTGATEKGANARQMSGALPL